MSTEVIIKMLPTVLISDIDVDVAINGLVFVKVGVDVDILSDIVIFVVDASDLTIKVLYVVEVLVGAIISGTPGSDAEVNANGLAAMMTGFKRAVPTTFIEPFLSC